MNEWGNMRSRKEEREREKGPARDIKEGKTETAATAPLGSHGL